MRARYQDFKNNYANPRAFHVNRNTINCGTMLSNPFVMGAGVSKNLRGAEAGNPMHRKGLRRLQVIVDDLMIEVRTGGRIISSHT